MTLSQIFIWFFYRPKIKIKYVSNYIVHTAMRLTTLIKPRSSLPGNQKPKMTPYQEKSILYAWARIRKGRVGFFGILKFRQLILSDYSQLITAKIYKPNIQTTHPIRLEWTEQCKGIQMRSGILSRHVRKKREDFLGRMSGKKMICRIFTSLASSRAAFRSLNTSCMNLIIVSGILSQYIEESDMMNELWMGNFILSRKRKFRTHSRREDTNLLKQPVKTLLNSFSDILIAFIFKTFPLTFWLLLSNILGRCCCTCTFSAKYEESSRWSKNMRKCRYFQVKKI